MVCSSALNAIPRALVDTLPILRLCARPALLLAKNVRNLRQTARSVWTDTGYSITLVSLLVLPFTSLKANLISACNVLACVFLAPAM